MQQRFDFGREESREKMRLVALNEESAGRRRSWSLLTDYEEYARLAEPPGGYVREAEGCEND